MPISYHRAFYDAAPDTVQFAAPNPSRETWCLSEPKAVACAEYDGLNSNLEEVFDRRI